MLQRCICCPQGDSNWSPNTMGTQHPHSITFHVGYALHSQGFVSSSHRLLSLSLTCILSLCRCLCVCQLHFAILCDGALEELSGYARAGPGLQRLSRHWLHFGEGETNTNWLSLQIHKRAIFLYQSLHLMNQFPLTPQTHKDRHTPTLNMIQTVFPHLYL